MWVKAIAILLVLVIAKADENSEILDLLKDIAKRNGVVSDGLRVIKAIRVGQGSINKTKVDVEVDTPAGEKKKLSVLLNGYPMDDMTRQYYERSGEWAAFEQVFTEVLPQMERLSNRDKDVTWARNLGVKDYITLEEYLNKDWTAISSFDRMDLAHCKLAIDAVAKFHAMSAALKEEKKINIGKLPEATFLRDGKVNYYDIKPFDLLANAVEHTWEPEWAPVASELRALSNTYMDDINQNSKVREDSFNVINVGGFVIDCLLFKHNENKEPSAVKMDCLRAVYYNTPAFDLQTFLASSPSNDVLLHHRDELIYLYHESLVKYLKQYKYKGKVPDLDFIKNEMKRTDVYGMGLAIVYLAQEENISKEEKDKLEEKMTKLQQEKNVLIRPMMLGKNYKEIMKKIIQINNLK